MLQRNVLCLKLIETNFSYQSKSTKMHNKIGKNKLKRKRDQYKTERKDVHLYLRKNNCQNGVSAKTIKK